MKTIVFVTGNKTKLLHANEAVKELGYEFVGHKLSLVESREEEPERVVEEKALQAFGQLNVSLVVEDSGIFIEALNGFPKTFVHFVQDTIGVAGIVRLMEGVSNRKAEFRQALAYMAPGMSGPKVFSYVDGEFSVAEKVWENKEVKSAEFDKILIPPGESVPLCMFSQQWRAERDTRANFQSIHYRQLVKWLNNNS